MAAKELKIRNNALTGQAMISYLSKQMKNQCQLHNWPEAYDAARLKQNCKEHISTNHSADFLHLTSSVFQTHLNAQI